MKAIFIALIAGAVGCASVQPVSAADAVTYKEKVLWSFGNGTDGNGPVAGLVNVNGTLYGTTTNGGTFHGDGTAFSFVLATGAEKVLYSFGNGTDGARPESALIAVDGTLYGTTYYGGHSGGGTVFSLDPGTGAEKVLYSFCGQQNCADGEFPFTDLVDVKGTLYGTTWEGGGTGCGGSGCGTVFSLDPGTGAEKVLYSFCSQQSCANGAFPSDGALIRMNGMLYGTTYGGGVTGCGSFDCGTVFSINRKTGAEKVLYSFCQRRNCADGASPGGSLTAVNGTLYGTTAFGGSTGCGGIGCGTVFSLDPNTGAETVLYSFCQQQNCADGSELLAGLIDFKGALYGTSLGGGAHGWGTVFAVDPGTGVETVLHSFCSQQNCMDGAAPYYGSLIAVDGKLYGTTELGGAYNQEFGGDGTVFVLEKKRQVRVQTTRRFASRTLVRSDGYPNSPPLVVKFKRTNPAWPFLSRQGAKTPRNKI